MTYELDQTRIWDRATPNDGELLEAEFNRVYGNFRHLRQENFTFDGDISISGSLDVTGEITGIEPWKLVFVGEMSEVTCMDLGLYKVILRYLCAEPLCSPLTCYLYHTVHCGFYCFSKKNPTPVNHKGSTVLLGTDDTGSHLVIEGKLLNEAKKDYNLLKVQPGTREWKIHLVYKWDAKLSLPKPWNSPWIPNFPTFKPIPYSP
jgi:hypothetical protein